MNGALEQARAAVAAAVAEAGAAALTAFPPGWAKAYRQPLVAVGLRTGECRGGAVGSYLGQYTDPETQTVRELYGARMDLTLSLDIYGPAQEGAAGCDGALEALHRAVFQRLPSGLRPTELKWEEAKWDPDTGMFLRKGCLTCGAFFTAEADEDGEMLTDFVLKGVVKR